MNQQIRVLQNQREAKRGQLASLKKALSSATDPSAQASLWDQVEAMEIEIENINAEIGQLEMEEQTA